MLLALIVMPRSRSRSMESSTCSCISRDESAPVISSKRSARVDLPWSMCAMIQKLRMNCGSMDVHNRQELSHARDLRRTQRQTAPCNHSVCHNWGRRVRLGVGDALFGGCAGESTVDKDN